MVGWKSREMNKYKKLTDEEKNIMNIHNVQTNEPKDRKTNGGKNSQCDDGRDGQEITEESNWCKYFVRTNNLKRFSKPHLFKQISLNRNNINLFINV